MFQRDIFLSGEGDNWFIRNKPQNKTKFPEVKFLTSYLKEFRIQKFLEIGCSSGKITKKISKKLRAKGFGIDPSELAIASANTRRFKNLQKYNLTKLEELDFSIGSSENLNFESEFFDFIYFGFCLYLVDRSLVTQSLTEANRCLKPGGFLAIKDFDYGIQHSNPYKHRKGIISYKDDYTYYFIKLGYNLVSKESYISSNKIGYSINPDDRVSIWLMHKPN